MTTAKLGRSALVILACGLAVAVAGCARAAQVGTGSGDSGVGGLGAAASPSVAATDPAGGDQPDAGGRPGGGQPTTGGQATGAPKPSSHTTTSPPPSGPQIVYFRIAQQPVCPQGTTQNPIPGKDVVIEWKVTGADKVSLSVDGPGTYNTYDLLQGSETLGFGCGGYPDGAVVKHTYTIYTVGGGTQRSMSITAQATAHDIIIVAP